jgi:hypothetical protein
VRFDIELDTSNDTSPHDVAERIIEALDLDIGVYKLVVKHGIRRIIRVPSDEGIRRIDTLEDE